MPVALVLEGRPAVRVPLVVSPTRVGRGPGVDVVLEGPALPAVAAEVRRVHGGWLACARQGCTVRAAGRDLPFLALRHGDRFQLAPGAPAEGEGVALGFEDHLEGSWVPEGASLAEGWMGHDAFARSRVALLRYGPQRPLGRPGSGTWRVEDPACGVALVLKELGPVHEPHEGDLHLALLASLAGAPIRGLCRVVDGGIAPAAPPGVGAIRWMVAAWVPGRSGRDHLAASGPLGAGEAIAAMGKVATALAALHARGILHGDLSPGNVVVGAGRDAALVDLGRACFAKDAPPAQGVVGTPGYLAPERVLGGVPLTPEAEVYGLAATTYALLCGRPPAAGEDVLERLARSASRPPAPRDLGVDLPEALEGALLEALDPDPARRPTAMALARTLRFAAATLAVGEPP